MVLMVVVGWLFAVVVVVDVIVVADADVVVVVVVVVCFGIGNCSSSCLSNRGGIFAGGLLSSMWLASVVVGPV